ncbi:MAG: methylglyoxal synthase [Candidatus Lokiarchaeota archaeon]|nr:methylglyoxal synthase [Candidatus Lokiarchaeota archaeon]
MIEFVQQHRFVLENFELVCTGTTGGLIEKEGIKVEKKNSGPLGGDIQIAAMVVENQIMMVLFFQDVMNKHPHEPDIQAFIRLCNLYDVPLATNANTAKILVANLKSISHFHNNK